MKESKIVWHDPAYKSPEDFHSVIVWGTLEGDRSPLGHEGFIDKSGWNTVREGVAFSEVIAWAEFPKFQ